MDKEYRNDVARNMTRREALKFGSLTALGLAGAATLAGCAAKTTDSSSSSSSAASTATAAATSTTSTGAASFLTAPDAIADSDISETKDCEVVVIGSGLASMSAVRSMVESGQDGSKVIVVEKAETWQYRSNQVGCIGGQVQEKLGISLDKNGLVHQLMKECGYRPQQRILNLWADNSGEAFDWYLKASDGQYVIENESDTYDGTSMSVRKLHFPYPETAHPENDYYPIFDDCQILLPDQGPYLENVYNINTKAGVTYMFSTWARQLVRPNNSGQVTGVIVQDADGKYTKINASKAVLLATGDFAGNSEMLAYYCPWAKRFPSIFPNVDAAGTPTNTGDGQCMGMWIGAKMEDGPLAPMTHHLGGPLGVDAFLLVNINGDRVVNEDVGGQPIQNQISRAPQKKLWQIFDSKWQQEIGYMDTGHGNVSWFVDSGDKVPNGSYGKNAYIAMDDNEDGNTPGFNSYFTGKSAKGVTANSIDELASAMDVPADELKKTIERYNELAAKGSDEDFGKRADRMFALDSAPYYAYPLTDTVMLVCMGGLQTDVDFNVYDSDDALIPGLYAVGNVQGGRVLVDYPLPAPGISHGMALTHGMLVGRVIAKL